MKENTLYNLAQTLQNNDFAKQETSTFLEAIHQKMEQEYLCKIRSAASAQKDAATKHPPKEVTLLRAVSPFLDTAGQQRMDMLCRTLMLRHTVSQIAENVQNLSADGSFLETRSQQNGENTSALSPQAVQTAGLLTILSLLQEF